MEGCALIKIFMGLGWVPFQSIDNFRYSGNNKCKRICFLFNFILIFVNLYYIG
jgi:hypothetical protein